MPNHGFIKVAAASPRLELGNPAANAPEILRLWGEADKCGALCVSFPELSLTGATCADMFLLRGLQTAALEALEMLRKGSGDLRAAALAGLPLVVSGRLYNVAALICQGRILSLTPKRPDARQQRWFAQYFGEPVLADVCASPVPFGINLIPFGDVTLGIAFDSDALISLPRDGANMLLMPAAVPAAAGEYPRVMSFLRHISALGHSALCFSGAGVGESVDGFVYPGDCAIFEGGEVLDIGARFQSNSQLAIADVDMDALNARRQVTPGFANTPVGDLVPSLLPPRYILTEHFERTLDRHPFFKDEPEFLDDAFRIQVAALTRRAQAARAKKLIVAVSGGADSTQALLVAREAANELGFGPSGVVGVTMPGFGTGEGTTRRALRLMELLGVDGREIDITDVCIKLLRDMGHNTTTGDIAYENVQARARKLIPLTIANMENGLEVATGDLSEAALGWCTLGGDQTGMYNVNAGLPKTMLLAILRRQANVPGNEAIREVILEVANAPISPELVKDKSGKPKKTEDTVGPYALHDFFLYHLLSYGASRAKLQFLAERAFAEEFTPEIIARTLDILLSRFVAQQFKRSSAPNGPAVLDVAFSGGAFTMPADARGGAL